MLSSPKIQTRRLAATFASVLLCTTVYADDKPAPASDAVDLTTLVESALVRDAVKHYSTERMAAPKKADNAPLQSPPFVDRAEFINVVREQRGLELWRLWSNDRARVFVGVGPSGFAGLNLAPLPRQRARVRVQPVQDLALQIRQLTTTDATNGVE